MSNVSPKVDTAELNCEKVMMPEQSPEKAKLLHAYSVLLARILCKIPAFQQFKKLVPSHLPHEFSEKMSQKSAVYPLPIMFKNESKHEDCMAIMDSYEEQLINLYGRAFGMLDFYYKLSACFNGGNKFCFIFIMLDECLVLCITMFFQPWLCFQL